MSLTPAQIHALFERGNNFIRLGNLKAALQDYDHVLAQQPDFAPAYFNRGFARQHGVGDIEGAIADYTQALALKPDFPEALINRAIAQTAQENYPAALADYAAALTLSPDSPQALVNRGEIYLLQGKYELAEADFQQAQQLKAGYRYAIAGLALSYFAQGRSAIPLWQSLLARNPQFADLDWVMAEMGWAESLRELVQEFLASLG